MLTAPLGQHWHLANRGLTEFHLFFRFREPHVIYRCSLIWVRLSLPDFLVSFTRRLLICSFRADKADRTCEGHEQPQMTKHAYLRNIILMLSSSQVDGHRQPPPRHAIENMPRCWRRRHAFEQPTLLSFDMHYRAPAAAMSPSFYKIICCFSSFSPRCFLIYDIARRRFECYRFLVMTFSV